MFYPVSLPIGPGRKIVNQIMRPSGGGARTFLSDRNVRAPAWRYSAELKFVSIREIRVTPLRAQLDGTTNLL